MQHNTAIRVVAAMGGGIGIPLLAWYLFRPPTWRDAQLAFEQAMVGGDPIALERFYDEEELKVLKLSKADATKIAREVLQPTFVGYKLLPVEKPPFKQGYLMTCQRPILANGVKVLGGSYVLDGPEGPKVQFTFFALSSLVYIQQQAYATGKEEYYEKHRILIEELEARNLRGYWDRPFRVIRPWAHIARNK